MNDTATIRARIHDSAIRRVTRTFAATLADIFTETLQNSRRAGATRVRVAVTGPADTGPLTVTVTDDGAGIADPAVLLSFGENGWSEDLVRREDAAGMGMLRSGTSGTSQAILGRPALAARAQAPGRRHRRQRCRELTKAGSTSPPSRIWPRWRSSAGRCPSG